MTASESPAPIVAVASGLDPSGGAGFVLDLFAIAEAGARGTGVVTALTVQDTRSARRCEPVAEDIIAEQLAALLSDYEVAAVKIGLVPNAAIAEVIATALALTEAPVVWDPVFSATAGTTLLYDNPRSIADVLAPECALITPNLGEAAVLGSSGHAIRVAYGCDVLIKGGHERGSEAVDVLFDGSGHHQLRSPRLDVAPPRGTGCFLAATTAALLAQGRDIHAALAEAKRLLSSRIAGAIGRGRGAPVLW